jgi:hypothetical protein
MGDFDFFVFPYFKEVKYSKKTKFLICGKIQFLRKQASSF